MKTAIIGAGIAGLAAATKLRDVGWEVTVFESRADVGGRMATVEREGFVFDTGATSIAPRAMGIEDAIMSQQSAEDLIEIKKPIHVHIGRRTEPGDPKKNATSRFVHRQGIVHLAHILAEDLDVQLETRIDKIEQEPGGFRVNALPFEAVVLAIPAPEAQDLLDLSGMSRPLGSARYRPCISVLLGYGVPLDKPYHALIDPDQQHPLTWLSIESIKSPGRAPDGKSAIVAQLSARYSKWQFEQSAERVVKDTVLDIANILGQEFREPEYSEVVRWWLSQPVLTASFESVNHKDDRLVVAGDGLLGGRIELAYETGRRAASILLEQTK